MALDHLWINVPSILIQLQILLNLRSVTERRLIKKKPEFSL